MEGRESQPEPAEVGPTADLEAAGEGRPGPAAPPDPVVPPTAKAVEPPVDDTGALAHDAGAPAHDPLGLPGPDRSIGLTRHDVYPEPMRAGRPAGAGPLGRAMSWLRRTVRSDQHRRESELDEQLCRIPQLSRPNTISVISPKGGVGKTTLSFVLGDLLASALHLRVVALDANPDFGTLAALAGDEHRSPRSLADLLADASRVQSAAELHPYVSRLPSGLHLLGAPAHAEVMALVTPGLYARLIDFLESFYEIVILDLGSGVTDPLVRFAVERADQSVVVTTPEWITAAGVLGALRHLQLEDGTVVLNQAPLGREARHGQAIVETFRRNGIATRATIPYDHRLHAMLDSGTYAFDDLSLATRVPVKELAVSVAARFV
jgi:MinD-like ATPase involved in chromosome partitioning or flagellar assembly